VISKLKNAFGAKFGALPGLPPALRNNLTPLLVLAVVITAAVMMFMWQDQANYKPVFGAREKSRPAT
jgi:flagellar M-ring protein FliF